MRFTIILSVLLFSVYSLAQVAAPSASPVAVPVMSANAGLMQIAGFAVAAIVAILDLIMALSPSLAANGILHSVYLFLKSISAPKDDSAAK